MKPSSVHSRFANPILNLGNTARIVSLSLLVLVVTACGRSGGTPENRPDATDGKADRAAVSNGDTQPDGVFREVAPDEAVAADRAPDLPTGAELGRDSSPGPDAAGEVSPGPDLGIDQVPALDLSPDRFASDGADARLDLPQDLGYDQGGDTPAAAACATALSGTSAFGAALTGTASFAYAVGGTTAPITSSTTVHVYFPSGLVAGAKVQLGLPSALVADQYFFGPQATLADDLSAAGLTVGGHGVAIRASLLPGGAGLLASVNKNFSNPSSDVVDSRTASVVMCPSGDLPGPSLRVLPGLVSPVSSLSVGASSPIPASEIAKLTVRSPRGPVEYELSAADDSAMSYAIGPNYVITATTAFPPGQPLSFDTSDVHDVLGRPVPVVSTGGPVLATNQVLADLTFGSAPPTGALACSGTPSCSAGDSSPVDGGAPSGMPACVGGCSVAGGALLIKSASPTGGSIEGLLALPGSTATKARVRLAVGELREASTGCSREGGGYASMRSGTLAAVGPDGETTAAVALTCNGAMSEQLLDLPAASPRWLVVHVESATAMPYMSPPPPGPTTVTIEEIEQM